MSSCGAAQPGTLGLVLGTAQHGANAAPSHAHLQAVSVLPFLFCFPSLPRLVLPSPDAVWVSMSGGQQDMDINSEEQPRPGERA